jgi:hypothetical protein
MSPRIMYVTKVHEDCVNNIGILRNSTPRYKHLSQNTIYVPRHSYTILTPRFIFLLAANRLEVFTYEYIFLHYIILKHTAVFITEYK